MPLPFCTCSVFKCIYCFHSHKRFNTKVKDYSGSLLLITNTSVLLRQQIHNALAIHKASLKSNSLILRLIICPLFLPQSPVETPVVV